MVCTCQLCAAQYFLLASNCVVLVSAFGGQARYATRPLTPIELSTLEKAQDTESASNPTFTPDDPRPLPEEVMDMD